MAQVTFNWKLCKGCGLCVDACPRKILSMSKTNMNDMGYFTVNMEQPDRCTGCAACAVMCPDCVIEVEKF